ncbi:MAG: 3-hydroxyacyl-CoA dehydrogenase NAD-binding domain-containing protein [Thermoanaerobaculia bacterium]
MAAADATIERVAVLGAGTMGLGIAHVAALAGYETAVFDVSAEALERALARIGRNLDKGVELGKVEAGDARGAKERLRTTTDLAAAVGGADLVIEAVPEDMALKLDTFRRVVEACPDHTYLASNTSGLSVTEMGAATDRPERFAGMHFFNPVHVMKLLELVRGLDTAPETLEVMTEVGRRMGKTVVAVNESPGFVTSRINALIGNEAFRMLESGVAGAEDIDRALKLGLNHPMGPFELVDLVGLDIRLSILKFLHRTLGETYRPSPLLERYVQAGRLGRKVGRGVYEYDADGTRRS